MNYNADISVCSYSWQEESETIREDICDNEPKVLEGHAVIRQIFENKPETVVAWNKLYKKELFHSLRYAVGKLHEDEYIIHHLLYLCERIVYSPCKLYYYMQHSDSITNNLNDKRVRNTLEAFEQRARFFEEKGMIQERNETLVIWKREIRKKYNQCKLERFEGYQRTRRWLRKEFRTHLTELKEQNIITPREWVLQSVWTYSPACGIILEYVAALKQRFMQAQGK